MRVRRLVELIAVTLLVIAVFSVRDVKITPVSSTKASLTTVPASLVSKMFP